MRKMLFIFNPRSGKAQIRSRLMNILDIFTKAGYEVSVHVTQRPKDAMEVAAARGNDADLIAKNMIAAAHLAVEGEAYPVDIGSFCGDRNFVYIAAFGAFTEVSYLTPQDKKNMLGHQAYMLESVRSLTSIKSYRLRVESEEITLEGEFIFGMVTNTISVGGFKGLVTQNNEYVHKFRTKALTVIPEEPVDWVLDGEFGGTRMETQIINLQKQIRIMRNPSKKQ